MDPFFEKNKNKMHEECKIIILNMIFLHYHNVVLGVQLGRCNFQ